MCRDLLYVVGLHVERLHFVEVDGLGTIAELAGQEVGLVVEGRRTGHLGLRGLLGRVGHLHRHRHPGGHPGEFCH